jgi:hypothetical protein
MRTPGRRVLLQRPMWPMSVVMIDVLIKDQPQVPLAGDQHPVQALAPGAGDPAFRDRVREAPGQLSVPFGLAGTVWAYLKLRELAERRPVNLGW